MTERIDCIVIGAGVVGLAVARALALAGREVVIVEAEPAIGTGISARNSEVIHAGIYYAPGSLKATLCRRGKALLYAYCAARGVPHRRIGKLIVATEDAQRAALEGIRTNAVDAGLDDLVLLDGDAVRRMEPALASVAALLSPSTGIVDSHALMLSLLGDAEAHGASLALSSPVVSGRVLDDGIELTTGRDAAFVLEAALVVNCAGLHATRVTRSIDGVDPARVPTTHFAKGNYVALAGKSPFAHLVYPMPEGDGGLGVHLTLDLGGQAKFGPDVQWLADGAPLDYAVDPTAVDRFGVAIRRWWPDVPAASLTPAYTGIRPKLTRPGEAVADFVIAGPDQHGTAGLVALYGIESPGLTSSLAIGEYVADLVERTMCTRARSAMLAR